MKQLVYKILAGGALAGWMLVIFLFSAQPAEESGELSESVVFQLVDGAERVFGLRLSELDRFHVAELLSYPVRKCAHMTEYAVLALLAFCFFRQLGIQGRQGYGAAWLLAVLYAVTDEVHQIFVPGREGMVLDVCIDAAGAFLGLLCLKMIFGKMCRKKGKHCEKHPLPIQ